MSIFCRLWLLICCATLAQAQQTGGPPFQIQPIDEQLQLAATARQVIVGVVVKLPTDHYLYVDKTNLEVETLQGVQVGELQRPESVSKYDPYLKKNLAIHPGKSGELIFTRQLTLPSSALQAASFLVPMRFQYQGCGPKVCYLPTRRDFTVRLTRAATPELSEAPSQGKMAAQILGQQNTKVSKGLMQDWDFARITERGLIWAALLALLGGLVSSLTPCVYPMIPITIAVIGAKQAVNRWHSLRIGGIFAAGLALTYATLGVVAALSGALLGNLLQNPWVVGAVVLLFALMGLSMLGFFEFRLPASVNRWVSSLDGRQGSLGVFFTGTITGVVAAPCVGPVILGILTFVATQRQPLLGFWLLFFFAIGLSTPFVILGMFSSWLQRLPKSGIWMVGVKKIFGVLLIGVAIYYGTPLIPQRLMPTQAPVTSSAAAVDWHQDFNSAIDLARREKRPMMIDFFAEWCLACKELDATTYRDPQVVKLSKKYVNLKLDFTRLDDDKQKLLVDYNILALPAIFLFTADELGNLQPSVRVDGFIEAPELAKFMQQVSGP